MARQSTRGWRRRCQCVHSKISPGTYREHGLKALPSAVSCWLQAYLQHFLLRPKAFCACLFSFRWCRCCLVGRLFSTFCVKSNMLLMVGFLYCVERTCVKNNMIIMAWVGPLSCLRPITPEDDAAQQDGGCQVLSTREHHRRLLCYLSSPVPTKYLVTTKRVLRTKVSLSCW